MVYVLHRGYPVEFSSNYDECLGAYVLTASALGRTFQSDFVAEVRDAAFRFVDSLPEDGDGILPEFDEDDEALICGYADQWFSLVWDLDSGTVSASCFDEDEEDEVFDTLSALLRYLDEAVLPEYRCDD